MAENPTGNNTNNNEHNPGDFKDIEQQENNDLNARRVASGKDDFVQADTTNAGAGQHDTLLEDERMVIESESSGVNNLQQGQGPLDQPVIERGYAQRQYTGDTMSPIDEPVEVREVINPNQQQGTPGPSTKEQKASIEEQQIRDKKYASEGMGEKENPRTGGNPAVTTMTTKERQQNLEMTVTSAIDGYEKAKVWIGGWLTISDATLIDRQNKGKTPPDWAVLFDVSTGEKLTLREFVHEGNKRIEQACQTSEDFKNKIRPVLMAEFDRRNWIFSPKTNGLFLVGSDLFSMGQKLFTIYMNQQKILTRIDKEFKERMEHGFLSARDIYNMNKNFINHQQQAPAGPATENTTVHHQQPAAEHQAETTTANNSDVTITKKTVETITIPAEEGPNTNNNEFEEPID